MNPFLNPNYYPQYQQPVQTMTGRFVNDFNEITANEVSMTMPSVFVKNDRSAIQVKSWGNDGRIITVNYEPKIEPINTQTDISTLNGFNGEFERIMNVLDAINDKIDAIGGKKNEQSNKSVTKSTRVRANDAESDD